jgi:hypothetical protein
LRTTDDFFHEVTKNTKVTKSGFQKEKFFVCFVAFVITVVKMPLGFYLAPAFASVVLPIAEHDRRGLQRSQGESIECPQCCTKGKESKRMRVRKKGKGTKKPEYPKMHAAK